MFTRFRFKTLFVASAAVVLSASMAPSAQATLFTGACQVTVTFDFNTPVRATGTSPSYTVELTPSVVDFSPDLVTGWDGIQPCLVTLDAFDPVRDTRGVGEGTSTIWTCTTTAVAGGFWNQDWANREGSSSPPSLVGQHFISGPWGDWTFTLTSPTLNFVGVAQLTAAPFENLKQAACLNGTGIRQLTMIGTLVFQDP